MVGPYLWQTYDLLVLPPSFPFGGMENPNLTFVSPGLIVSSLFTCKYKEERFLILILKKLIKF